MGGGSRPLNPSTCALLVIDMQNRFGSIAKHLALRLSVLSDALFQQGIPVFLTQHHDEDDKTTELIKFWGDDVRIRKESEDWKLMEEFENTGSKGAKLIQDKTTYDAFYKTELESQLRELGVEQVIITGTVTNLCCETTARSAVIHDFQVFFVDDLTAAAAEAHHKGTITNLKYGFATVVRERDVRKSLGL